MPVRDLASYETFTPLGCLIVNISIDHHDTWWELAHHKYSKNEYVQNALLEGSKHVMHAICCNQQRIHLFTSGEKQSTYFSRSNSLSPSGYAGSFRKSLLIFVKQMISDHHSHAATDMHLLSGGSVLQPQHIDFISDFTDLIVESDLSNHQCNII